MAFDILALTSLEMLYDVVEDRFGPIAAVLITTAMAFGLIGVFVWVLIKVSQ
jgi:hypothetical protein